MPSVFHDRAIALTLDVHNESVRQYGRLPNDIRRDAFFMLTHDAICVHRAIGTLADNGWPGPAGALLRTLMDMNASALALAHSGFPHLAAFKYLYSGLRRFARDQRLPSADRRRMFQQVRERLNSLPTSVRQEALDVMKERDRPYWFAPEWPNPGSIIEHFGGSELRWIYNLSSAAAHGTFLGMRLYREDPDAISISPEPAGPKALKLDFASCRFLLELARIRATVEGLDFDARINGLVGEIRFAVDQMPAP